MQALLLKKEKFNIIYTFLVEYSMKKKKYIFNIILNKLLILCIFVYETLNRNSK